MQKDKLYKYIKKILQEETIKNQPEEDKVKDEEPKAGPHDFFFVKYPSLKNILVKLFGSVKTIENGVEKINIITNATTTFKINLKNGNNFLLLYMKDSWLMTTGGNKYWLTQQSDFELASKQLTRLITTKIQMGGGEKPEEDDSEDVPKEKPEKEEK